MTDRKTYLVPLPLGIPSILWRTAWQLQWGEPKVGQPTPEPRGVFAFASQLYWELLDKTVTREARP